MIRLGVPRRRAVGLTRSVDSVLSGGFGSQRAGGLGPKGRPRRPRNPGAASGPAGPQAAIRDTVTATARRLGELCAHGPSARAAASLSEYIAYPSGPFHGPIEQESNALSTNLRLAIGDEKGPSRWRVCLIKAV
jgi:hypothetical protein